MTLNMIEQTIQPINEFYRRNLEFKHKNIDTLDLIESRRCTEKQCQHAEFRIGCPNCRPSNIQNLKYYVKNKLEDLKLQIVVYKSHFKRPCFNCSFSFHASRFEDDYFNLQKIFELDKKCFSCQRKLTMERSFHHNCNICNGSFKSCKILVNHRINEHNSKKPYQCAVCHLSLNESALSCHIYKHKLPHICPFCSKRYARKSYLKLHILRVCDPSSEKKFKCKLCDKGFYDKYKFKAHNYLHEKPFACKYCDKCFPSRMILEDHSYIHTGDWPYKCSICKKGFSTEKTFSNHILSHTGEKPFSCKYCPKQYQTKRSLDLHLFDHTGGKQFKCDICDKTFVKRFMLIQHQPVHMKKSFQCTICSKFYKTPKYLENHISRVHKVI